MPAEFFSLRQEEEDKNKIGYLSRISFAPEVLDTRRKYSFLDKASTWQDIPPMAIITGSNGQGKSVILEYIKEALESYASKTKSLDPQSIVHIDYSRKAYKIREDTSGSSGRKYFKDSSYIQKILNHFSDKGSSKRAQKSYNPFEAEIIRLIRHDIEYKKITQADLNPKIIEQYSLKSLAVKVSSSEIVEFISNFTKIFDAYYKRLVYIHDKIKQNKLEKIYEFYKTLTEEALSKITPDISHGLEYGKFTEAFIKQKKAQDPLLNKCLESIAGSAPWDEINYILEKYNFKYRVKHVPKKETLGGPQVVFTKEDTEVFPEDLSAGERQIITLLSMQYVVGGLSSSRDGAPRRTDNKVKILLLDEFDSHYDPKLCKTFLKIISEEFVKKNGIQVIMSSHRIDTVALAPDEGIFVVQKASNGCIEVAKTHKLQAMFRMASNVRELIGYHHKVYAESVNDAGFYEGAYRSLQLACKTIREKQQFDEKPGKYHWQIDGAKEPVRILSERYKMSFYAVSEEKKQKTKSKKDGNEGDGGCSSVIRSILKDGAAFGKLAADGALPEQNFLLREPKLHSSYGILDNDHGKDHKLPDKGLERSVAVLQRHSLENFLLDPIILCSSLTTSELTEFVKQSNLLYKRGRSEHEEGGILLVFELMSKEIQKEKASRDNDFLQFLVGTYFQYLFETIEYVLEKDNTELSGKTLRAHQGAKDFFAKKEGMFDTEVTLLSTSGSTFTLKYPKEFLDLRGHDIVNYLFGKNNKCDIDEHGTRLSISEYVAFNIQKNGLKFIPLDLAEVFFELNSFIRENVRSVIKPSKEKIALAPEDLQGHFEEGKDAAAPLGEHNEIQNVEA